MLTLHVENLGNLTVIECKGRIVRSDCVFKLRDVVMAQSSARIIVLDLCEVDAIGGGGLGMLALVQRWASDHDIQLKLFDPSSSVLQALNQTRVTANFDIASFHQMMAILAGADTRYGLAA
jgi:anti-anti-sigma regulatory factor